jgi:hypothetical protein
VHRSDPDVRRVSQQGVILALSTLSIPPPASQRAQAKARPPLHLDPLTLVRRLHLLALCRLGSRYAWRTGAVHPFARWSGRPPTGLHRGVVAAGRLAADAVASLVPRDAGLVAQVAGLGTGLWIAPRPLGQPRVPSPSHQGKRGRAAGAPVGEALLIMAVQVALRRRLIGARDLISDSAPVLAWWQP